MNEITVSKELAKFNGTTCIGDWAIMQQLFLRKFKEWSEFQLESALLWNEIDYYVHDSFRDNIFHALY